MLPVFACLVCCRVIRRAICCCGAVHLLCRPCVAPSAMASQLRHETRVVRCVIHNVSSSTLCHRRVIHLLRHPPWLTSSDTNQCGRRAAVISPPPCVIRCVAVRCAIQVGYQLPKTEQLKKLLQLSVGYCILLSLSGPIMMKWRYLDSLYVGRMLCVWVLFYFID